MRARGALALAAFAVAVCGCDRKKGAGPGAAAVAAPDAGPRASGARLVLGHVAQLTGDQATFGQSTDRGVRLAVNEQNAKGGVKGHIVELRTVDDGGKADEAAVAATRLATQVGAAALLGESSSARSLAMAPVADTAAVPMVSPSSTSPRVTREGDRVRAFVFRVCFTDAFQGAAMASFVRDGLKLDRVAILRDAADESSAGLADAFAARLRALGGVVVADESYRAGDRDFKAQLESLKGKDAQALYVPGSYAEAARVALQAREVGLTQPLLGADGWDSSKLYELGGKAVDGAYFTNHYAPDVADPRVRDFVKRYKEAWGDPPDAHAALGYDAARVVMEAMVRATEPAGVALRDAIAQTKGFAGVTGAISIDPGHDAVKPAVVVEVRNGGPRYVTTIRPEPAPVDAAAQSQRPDGGAAAARAPRSQEARGAGRNSGSPSPR
jgi:branched-chain amino acid transport system substrate-binding protein